MKAINLILLSLFFVIGFNTTAETIGSPVISFIQPGTGAKGDKFEIRGSNFVNVLSVSLGGKAAAFSLIDSTRMTVTVPELNVASHTRVGLVVRTTYGQSSNGVFTYITVPIAQNGYFRTYKGEKVVVGLTATGNPSSVLVYSIEKAPAHGKLSVSTSTLMYTGNAFYYTPNPDFTGIDTFRFKVSNGYKTSSAKISIAVNARMQMALGGLHTCVLKDRVVKCWGHDSLDRLKVPALSNPYQIVAGDDHTCALDDTGMKCWGSNNYGQLNVPALSHPQMMAAASLHTCAIDDSGVKCWGSNENSNKLLNPPVLSNPRSIQADERQTCAWDDTGIKCWGDNYYSKFGGPVSLLNIKAFSVGAMNVCSIYASNLVGCWGYNGWNQNNVPSMTNPRAVTVGLGHACALDGNQVKCWGFNDSGQTEVPALSNPTAAFAGFLRTCAVDDFGIKCWGYEEAGLDAIPAEYILEPMGSPGKLPQQPPTSVEPIFDIPVQPSPSPIALIQNGDFDSGLLTPWMSDRGTVVSAPSFPFISGKAFYVESREWSAIPYLAQKIRVTGGKKYQVVIPYVAVNTNRDSMANLQIYLPNAATTATFDFRTSGQIRMDVKTLIFAAPGTGTVDIHLLLSMGSAPINDSSHPATGKIQWFFDNITLTEIP